MSTRSRAAVVSILALHLALTIWLSASLSIRVDEAYSLHTTSMGLAYAVREAIVWELQPPLYFSLLELWRHIGSSIFFARLLSVLAVALGIYVVGLVARRYLSEHHRPWVMAVVAFNPFIIASATDARVYGFVFLWSALLMWLFFEAYLSRDKGIAWRLAFAVVAVAALYTQYYTGFLLPAFAVVLAMQRRWRDVGAFAAWMAAVAASFVPLAHFVRAELHTNAINYVNTQSFVGNLIALFKTLAFMIVPLDWAGHLMHLIAFALILFAIAVIAWRSNKAEWLALTRVPAIIVVTAAILFAGVVTVVHMPITSHYASAFQVPAYILFFALISAVREPSRTRAIALASAALVATNVASLVFDYVPLAKPGDAERVAAFISMHESPNERIVVFDAQSALPLAYYYKGPNPIVPMPRPMRFDRYDLRDIAINEESDVVRSLGYRPKAHTQLWLVSPPAESGCRRFPVNLHCKLLYDFIAKHYETILDQQFFLARVRLLRERQ